MTKAPDPAGARPNEFPETQWSAYQQWATGATRIEAAAAAGMSKTTIGRWIKQWRTHYDTDGLDVRAHGFTHDAQQAGADASALARKTRWLTEREGWADRRLDTMEKVELLLGSLLNGPLAVTNKAIADMEPGEAGLLFTRLQRAMSDASRDADRYAKIPPLSPVRVQETIDVEFGERVDPQLFDGFYTNGETDAEILHDLQEIRAEHEAQREAQQAAEPEPDAGE